MEIADDYIAVTIRPQSHLDRKRVRSVLWPDTISRSLWQSLGVFSSLQYARLKGALGIGAEREAGQAQLPRALADLRNSPKPPSKQDTSPSAGSDKSLGQSHANANADAAQGAASQRSSNSMIPNILQVRDILPSFNQTRGDLGSAAAVFYKTLVQRWTRSIALERGAIALSGLVQIGGSRATLVVDVIGSYLPETQEVKVLSVRIRRGNPTKVSPRGGR